MAIPRIMARYLFIQTINKEHLADGAIRAALVRRWRPLLLYIRRRRVYCQIRIVGRGIASWDGYGNGHGHMDGRFSWSLHITNARCTNAICRKNKMEKNLRFLKRHLQ